MSCSQKKKELNYISHSNMKAYHLIAFGIITMVFPAFVQTQSTECDVDCSVVPGGYYHLCDTCTYYIQCAAGIKYTQPCPPYLFWDNDAWGCLPDSTTCPVRESPCGFFNVENGDSFIHETNNRLATYTCFAGYMPRISGLLVECPFESNYEWVDIPSNLCIQEFECGAPPEVKNGSYEINLEDPYTAKARCNDGYKPEEGTPDIECVNGQWTGVTADFCGRGCVRSCIDQPDGYYAHCDGGGNFVICSNERTSNMNCGETQFWDDEAQTCDVLREQCDPLPETEAGFFEVNGDEAVLQCKSGFVPRTVGYKVYCVNGQWNLQSPLSDLCTEDTTCDPPPYVPNGWFEPQDDNTVARLECDNGYTSTGAVITIECVDGEWPAITEEFCQQEVEAISCGDPPGVENGAFVLDLDPNTATLRCDEKHRPAQNYTIECNKDGTWPPIPDNICIPEFNSTAKGKTFVVAFFEKLSEDVENARLYIFMTTSRLARVNISSPVPLYMQKNYTFNDTLRIEFDPATFLQVKGEKNPVKSRKLIRVDSDFEINVYSYIEQQRSATANILHPTDSIGTEYLLVAGPQNPSYALVGLHNFTRYTITYPDGSTSKSAIMGGMVYYTNMLNEFKLTGTHIKSDKPIVVFSGNKCTKVPADVSACDTLVEQMPTIASLQYVYVLSYMFPRVSYRLEVVVPFDDTTIEIGNSSNPDSLTVKKDKGESLILDLNNKETIYVKGDKPIMVVKYSHGNEYDNVSIGDPCMMMMPGIGQFEADYFYTSIGDFQYEKVYIIIAKKDRDGLRLNGEPVVPKGDNPEITINIPLYGEYCIVYFDVMKGMQQHLTHVEEKQFGAVQYGAKMYVQYGFSLGYKMRSNAP